MRLACYWAVTLATFLLLNSPSHSLEILRSATWAFHSKCISDDLVTNWSVHGSTNPGSWHIPPWEEKPIWIRAIELAVVAGQTPDWLMAGNGLVPDMMVYMVPPARYVRHTFPPGTGMPMMGKNEPRQKTDYIDLHGGCMRHWPMFIRKRFYMSVQFTVYYTFDTSLIGKADEWRESAP